MMEQLNVKEQGFVAWEDFCSDSTYGYKRCGIVTFRKGWRWCVWENWDKCLRALSNNGEENHNLENACEDFEQNDFMKW